MKILTFLIGSLGGGGAERVTVALADYFCEKGYSVYFIAFSRENDNYDLNPKIKISFLPESDGKKISIIFRIADLKRQLKEQNPDYVFSLGLGYQYLLLGNLINKYKFILSERNAPQYYYKWYQKYYVRYCYKRAYKVVFQTQEAEDYFGDLVKGKAEVIPNPITSDLPCPFKGTREKRIVAVNRLSKQKNIFMLFRAFQKLSQKYPEYVLELYGKGEQKEELEQYAQKLQISEKVIFKGQKAKVHDYIVSAAMFVSSSDFEGMSNSMLEAMAIGLPVVCTDCPIGGARMVIENGVNGLLTPVGDAEKFTEAMECLIEKPDFAERLGNNASQLRDELNSYKIAEKWETLL